MKHSASLIAILALVGILSVPSFAQPQVGGDLGVWGVYTQNTTDLDKDTNDSDAFLRMESHIWFQSELEENVKARVSVEIDRAFNNDAGNLTENGAIYDADGLLTYHATSYPQGGDLDVYLEEAFIEVVDPFGMDWPCTWTLGRQFMQLGSGFVVGDSLPASPGDISWLGMGEQDPFDAIKMDWEINEEVDFILAYTKVAETRMNRQDTDIALANLRFSGIENAVFEILYMFYNDDIADQITVHQLGLRGELNPLEWLKLNAELAWQFAGEEEEEAAKQDIGKGFAAELGAKITPESMADNKVAFGGSVTWLSGDDDLTDEDYDGYVGLVDNRLYGEIADYYGGLVTNPCFDSDFAGVYIFNLDAEMTTASNLRLALEAYYFLAQEDIEGDLKGKAAKDTNIGWELDVYADYPLTEDLKAHAAAGFFEPDDAAEISKGGSDTAWFARAGLTVAF
jgi:hypothetical protein